MNKKKKMTTFMALTVGVSMFAPQMGVLQENPIRSEAKTTKAKLSQTEIAQRMVAQAESIRYMEYTDATLKVVIALPKSSLKTELTNRVNKLKSQQMGDIAFQRLDLMVKNSAEDLAYIKKLRKQITVPEIGKGLDQSINRAEDRMYANLAENRIDIIANQRMESDISLGKTYVSKITDTNLKASMTKRLTERSDRVYYEIIDSLIESYNQTSDKAYLTKAKGYAKNIQTKDMKARVLSDINKSESRFRITIVLSPEDKAHNAIRNANNHPTDYSFSYARSLIKKVSNKNMNKELSNRLKVLEEGYNADKFIKRMKIAQGTLDTNDINLAKSLIAKSPSETKKTFTSRLSEVSDLKTLDRINLLQRQRNLISSDISLLKSLASSISAPNEKARMNKMVAELEQAYTVEKVSRYMTAVRKTNLLSDYNLAKTAINKLTDKTLKTRYLNDLKPYESKVQ